MSTKVKLPKLKLGDMIEVSWRDHWGSAGWVSAEHFEYECINTSLQYFHSIKNGYLYGFQTVGVSGSLSGAHGIIVSDITKIRKIK